MTRKRAKSDGGLPNAILELCASLGVEADRRNSGEVIIPGRGESRYRIVLCKLGTFDIFGYCERRTLPATAFEIECKSTTGEERKAQIARAGLLTRLGIPWTFARSIGEAKRFLEWLMAS